MDKTRWWNGESRLPKALMKYQEKAENRDTVRPLKRLLDCYIEAGTEYQVLSPCDDDDDDDELKVDGFVDGRNAVVVVTSVAQSTRTTGYVSTLWWGRVYVEFAPHRTHSSCR
jgi:hypothetical protein